jgi:hypothetical protein
MALRWLLAAHRRHVGLAAGDAGREVSEGGDRLRYHVSACIVKTFRMLVGVGRRVRANTPEMPPKCTSKGRPDFLEAVRLAANRHR